jgi:phage portal protein BeeE
MVPGGNGAIDYYNRDSAPSALRLVRENLGTAYACGSLNAQLVAKTKLRLYVKTRKGEGRSRLGRNGKTKRVSDQTYVSLQKNAGTTISDAQDLEEVTDYPALTLLQKPNPKNGKNDGAGMSLFTLLETTQLYLETVGRAYWWGEIGTIKVNGKSLGKMPVQLWLLAPQYVTEWPGTGEDAPIIEYYQFALGTGTPNYYDPDEMVPFRMVDLATGGYTGGMSPLRACYEQIRIARFADATLSSRVQNGGRPDALFIPKGDEFGGTIGRDEAARLELQLRNRYRMAGAGSIMVADLPGTLEPVTWPMNDVIDAARYDLTRKQIAEAYAVPMTKLDRGDANRASAESGDFAHANDAGLPRLRRNEAAINTFLLPMYGDEAAERLFFAFDDPPGLSDPAMDLERFKTVVNTSWTTNEKRSLTGAKEVPNGDTILIAGTMTTLDEDGKPVPVAKPAGADNASKDGEPNANAGAAAESGNPLPPKPKNSKRVERILAEAFGRLADVLSAKNAAPVMPAIHIHNEREPEHGPRKDAGGTERATAENSVGGKSVHIAIGTEDANDGSVHAGVGVKAYIDGSDSVPEFAPPQPDAPALANALRTVFRHQHDAVMHQIDSVADMKAWIGARTKDAAKPEQSEEDKEEAERQYVADQLANLPPALDLSGWNETLAKVAEPLLLHYSQQAAKEAVASLPAPRIEPDLFDVVDRSLPQAVKAASLKFAESTNETTSRELTDAISDLRDELEEGITIGDTRIEMRKRVQTIFDDLDKNRADMIARTETSRARHDAQLMTVKESKVVSKKKWLASEDACQKCLNLAAMGPIDLDANFTVTNYGDVKSPPLHPSCLCSTTYVLKDLSEDAPDTEEKSVKDNSEEARDEHGQWTSGGLGGSPVLVRVECDTTISRSAC